MSDNMSISLAELLAKLEFFSLIEPDKKPCMKSHCFVSASSWSGAIYREFKGESSDNFILELKNIVMQIKETINDCKDSDYFMSKIINTMDKAVKGLVNLQVTYKNKPHIIASLNVQIDIMNKYLHEYKKFIPDKS